MPPTTQASLQPTPSASTISESWLPIDSEPFRKGNCSARAKSIVSRYFLQVTKFGAQWPIQSRPAEVGRLLFAMLAPHCCGLMIAPARKDRVDNGLEAPGLQG